MKPISTVQGRTVTRRELLSASLLVAGGAALSPAPAVYGGGSRRAAAQSGGETTIDFWYFWAGPGAQTIEDLISSFNQDNPSVSVRGKNHANFRELTQAIQVAAAAGNAPAVGSIASNSIRYVAEALPAVAVDQLAERDEEGTEWISRNFEPSILELGTARATQYALPWGVSNPVLYYNEDILRQAGLDRAPLNWDEAREYAQLLTDRTDAAGIYITEPSEFYPHQGLIESNGGQMLEVLGEEEYRVGIDGPEAVEAMQFSADMVAEGVAEHFSEQQGVQSFTSGLIAMAVFSSALKANFEQNANFPLGIATFPTFSGKPRKIPGSGYDLVVFAEDEQQQAEAWRFLKHLNTPESHRAWVESTGFLPTLRGVDGGGGAAADQAPDMVPWTSWPGQRGFEAGQTMVDARERILSGEEDAASALGSAAERIRELIGG
jgi:multiple sugar transport system substrate-binding protein